MKRYLLLFLISTLAITSCDKENDIKIEDEKIEDEKKEKQSPTEEVNSISKEWTKEQISKANTAKTEKYLSSVEKETVLYINLCRLFPQDFLKKELLTYSAKDSSYKKSLIALLKKMAPINALSPDRAAYDYAHCFALEQGPTGKIGHTRKQCPKGGYWECCSYGMKTGKDIVMQLLIDEGVTSLGHRKNCLNKSLNKIGVSHEPHARYGKETVIDMK